MSLFFDRAGLIAELRTSNLSSAIQEKVVQQARAAIAFKRCLRDMETVKVGGIAVGRSTRLAIRTKLAYTKKIG